MFTKKAIHVYDELKKPTAESKKLLAEFNEVYLSHEENNEDDVEAFDEKMRKEGPKLIFKLMQDSDFESIYQSRQDVDEVWASYLERLGFPSVCLKGKNPGDPYIEIIYAYVAPMLFKEYQESKPDTLGRDQLLNKACDYGYYHALDERINENIAPLNNEKTSPAEIKTAIDNIKADIKQLCHQFEGIGYLRAALAYMELAIYYRARFDLKEQAEGSFYVHEMVKHALCAQFLENDTYSAEVISSVTQKKGLLSIIKDENITDWPSGKTYLFNQIKSLFKPSTSNNLPTTALLNPIGENIGLQTNTLFNSLETEAKAMADKIINKTASTQITPGNQ